MCSGGFIEEEKKNTCAIEDFSEIEYNAQKFLNGIKRLEG